VSSIACLSPVKNCHFSFGLRFFSPRQFPKKLLLTWRRLIQVIQTDIRNQILPVGRRFLLPTILS
jgi:hypothetical protein